MKFSIVGDLPEALRLFAEIQRSPDHSLGHCHVTGELADALAAAGLPLLQEQSAENAFLMPGVDVVVMAVNDTEAVLQLVRSASQAERHVVVFPPSEVSTAFGFELHLLLDESPRSVLPVIGQLRLEELPRLLSTSAPHPTLIPAPESVQQIVMELAVGADDPVSLKRQQLEALDCLGALGLRYTQVTALESRTTNGSLISRLLTLGTSTTSDQTLPPATITLRSTSPAGVTPSDGKISLQVVAMDGTVHRHRVLDHPQLLPAIVAACASRVLCTTLMQSFATSLELSDAIDKSLRRRRTVDVYFDSGSERGVFKSQMTAIGCGVLTWTLLGMVVFLVTAQLVDLPPTLLHAGRILWILPVVLFLLAQLLLPLARDRSGHSQGLPNNK